jgi:hypothetical protein
MRPDESHQEKLMKSIFRVAGSISLLACLASAQAFNVDVGAAVGAGGIPPNTYAAAGTMGPWNSLDGAPGSSIASLVDVNGNTTSVMITLAGGLGNFFTNNAGTFGGDENLMDDLQDVGAPGNTSTVTFSNLANGKYTVRAYAWAPDNRTGFTTTITVVGGSGPQTLGGGWTGSLVAGMQYRVDTVTITGNTLSVQYSTAVGFGSVNGIQIEQAGTPTTSFCTAKSGLVCGTPSIFATGTSSMAANSGFSVSAGPARDNRSGILMYNNQGVVAAVPFQGGSLCVNAMGIRRAGSTNSMGSCPPTPIGCNGTFSVDMNAFANAMWAVPDCAGANSGIPPNNPAAFLLIAGTQVECQFWGRDSVATGSLVSDGLGYVVGP